MFSSIHYRLRMPDDDKLTPADPSDLADAIAFAVIFSGRKRVHDSDRFMARVAGDRIRRHLENFGYVVLKKPPIGGAGDNPGAKSPGF
jgi:hypothetical protein